MASALLALVAVFLPKPVVVLLLSLLLGLLPLVDWFVLLCPPVKCAGPSQQATLAVVGERKVFPEAPLNDAARVVERIEIW